MQGRWEPLADELAAVAAGGDVLGAAMCIYEGGDLVLDVAAGWTDLDRQRVRRVDDRFCIFSATKSVVSALVACLVADGLVDLDAPVIDLWPDFGAHGKAGLTVGDVLAHRAGVPATDRRMTLLGAVSVDTVADALAAQRPFWRPGRAHGYHAITWGPLVARIVERATGRSIMDELAERVVGPLGLHFSIGEPPPGDGGGDVLPLVPTPPPPAATAAALATLRNTKSLAWRAMTFDGVFEDPDGYAGVAEWPEVRHAVLPASGGVSDARSLARLHAALLGPVDGVRLADQHAVTAMTEVRSKGVDRCIWRASAFGAGFARRSQSFPLPFASSFGHTGVAGAVVFADPVTQLAGAYVPSRATVDVPVDAAWRRLSRVVRQIAAQR